MAAEGATLGAQSFTDWERYILLDKSATTHRIHLHLHFSVLLGLAQAARAAARSGRSGGRGGGGLLRGSDLLLLLLLLLIILLSNKLLGKDSHSDRGLRKQEK